MLVTPDNCLSRFPAQIFALIIEILKGKKKKKKSTDCYICDSRIQRTHTARTCILADIFKVKDRLKNIEEVEQ